MLLRNYLCVFIAKQDVQDDVLDKGLDPDFSSRLPTWGICQPPTRHRVEVGSYIVFLGYYAKDQPYLVKGWMKVGEKISYLDALQRFGDRRNVIIRPTPQAKLPVIWKREDLQEIIQDLHGTDRPDFLTTIHCNGQVYVQSGKDDHQIDNWKCQRMFRCQKRQLRRCIEDGECKRETEFPSLTDYIVAAGDEWQDIGPHLLDWNTIAPERLRDTWLGPPHHPRRLSYEEVMEIVNALRVFS